MDEVGRGAWAGPLVVGAVGLGCVIDGLCDSKKLSKSKRELLADQIRSQAKFVGIGVVESSEIDQIGLSQAHYLAYERAVAKLTGSSDVVIDGNVNYLPSLANAKCIIRADQTVAEVSAASIVAKVYRDNLMAKLSGEFPDYGFDSHVGYGTKKHLDALTKYGVTIFHRQSYKPIRAIINGRA